MRIPFDLLAAILAVEAIRKLFTDSDATLGSAWKQALSDVPVSQALLAIACFWVVSWLLHELVARRAEWAIRWGLFPQGFRIVETPEGLRLGPPRRHPLDQHAREVVFTQALTAVLYMVLLLVFAWPCKTYQWPYWLGLDRLLQPKTCEFVEGSYFVRGLLELGPFAIAMILALVPKHRVLVAELGRRDSLWKWLAFEMRLTFPPLLLWLIFNAIMDVLALTVPESAKNAVNNQPWLALVGGVLVLLFFAVVLMPWLMVRFWHARPLPDGELKERMVSLLDRSGVRARAILEWGAEGTGFANACVMGPWAPFRYILISPGLMRLLSHEECEAVIAHEIGHARHGHPTLLIFVILGLTAWSDLVLRGMDAMKLDGPVEQGLVLMLLLVLYLRIFFGLVMRRCERQADLSAAEMMGTPVPLVAALEKLARLSGDTRDVYSWHHDSIARRVERLSTEGLDPGAISRYHRSLRKMRWGLLVFSAVSIGVVLWLALTDPEPSTEKGSKGEAPSPVHSSR